MTGKLACVCLMLAACGEQPGLYLTINSATGMPVSQVAVYIGDDQCAKSGGGTCDIAPPQFAKVDAGDPGGTWYRDPGTTFIAGASGGTARVRIEPSGRGKKVQVIVLGLDGGGNPIAGKFARDLDVPATDSVSVSMTLDPATMFDGHSHQTGTFFDVWPDPSGDTECVFLQQWNDGQAMSTFIVPESDADCDGVPTLDGSGNANPLECDPYAYMAMGDVGPASCTENMDTVGNSKPCLLGGPMCKDGSGVMSGSCTRENTTTCVPSAICDGSCMMASSNTPPFSTCAQTNGATVMGTTIHCLVAMENSTGAPCTSLGSTASLGAMDLGGLFPMPGRAINEIDFAPVDQLYGIDDMLQKDQLITAQNDLEIDIVDQKAGSLYGYDLRWKKGSASSVAAGSHFAVADIQIDNGSNPDTHMRLPVRVDLGDCATAMQGVTCYAIVQANDTVTACGI